MRYVLPLVLAALLVGACGGGDDEAAAPEPGTSEPTTTEPEPTTTEPEPTTTESLAEGQRCANAEDGYTVRYPAGWSTNSGEVAAACRFFDPEPITLEPQTEAPNLAVSIRTAPLSYEELLEEDTASTPLTTEEAQVSGRQATVIESESTGEGLLSEGVRLYTYFVDLGDETLLIGTTDAGDLDYETNKSVVDEMAATLELAG